jgi:hypothetical protein
MTADPSQPADAASPPARFPANADEYVLAGAQWFNDTVRILSDEMHPLLKSFPRQTVNEFPDFYATDDQNTSLDYRQFVRRSEFPRSADVALDFNIDELLQLMADLVVSGAQQPGLGCVSDMA